VSRNAKEKGREKEKHIKSRNNNPNFAVSFLFIVLERGKGEKIL